MREIPDATYHGHLLQRQQSTARQRSYNVYHFATVPNRAANSAHLPPLPPLFCTYVRHTACAICNTVLSEYGSIRITGPGGGKKGRADGGVGCVIDVHTNYTQLQNDQEPVCVPPPPNVTLNELAFDFVSCDLPFPHHPFVLPILNTLGSFHPTIGFPSFVLISHPAHPPSFPTLRARAQPEGSRQTN